MNNPILIKDYMKHPSRILILIYLTTNPGKSITRMRKELSFSIASQWENLSYLKNVKLVNYKINKIHPREKKVYLTPTGKLIASKLNDLDLLLSSI